MSDPVDRRNLRVSGQYRAVTSPGLDVGAGDQITIVVAQAFGPRGDNLVGISDVKFDGYPAVTLKVKAGSTEGLVHLSPIHGDGRKVGDFAVPAGTHCELICPVSGQPLDFVADVEDSSGAKYYAIYLTPSLSSGSMVMVSNVWGHYHSRIIDDFELLSAWTAHNPD